MRPAIATICAGEVKARCGTSFYKNCVYPFVQMYDPEESHNLAIKVRQGGPGPRRHATSKSMTHQHLRLALGPSTWGVAGCREWICAV
jgi:hypothetical protein